jgi:small basic protein (TIGR04137 family)
MSIDRSLRIKSSLERHRNVLTRAERVARLQDQERWTDEQSVLRLPKIAHRKGKAGRKKAKTEVAAEAAAAPTTEAPKPT